MLEALWPLMVSANAEAELARDRAGALALRCEVCDHKACPGAPSSPLATAQLV